jgi:hypothetical protein
MKQGCPECKTNEVLHGNGVVLAPGLRHYTGQCRGACGTVNWHAKEPATFGAPVGKQEACPDDCRYRNVAS